MRLLSLFLLILPFSISHDPHDDHHHDSDDESLDHSPAITLALTEVEYQEDDEEVSSIPSLPSLISNLRILPSLRGKKWPIIRRVTTMRSIFPSLGSCLSLLSLRLSSPLHTQSRRRIASKPRLNLDSKCLLSRENVDPLPLRWAGTLDYYGQLLWIGKLTRDSCRVR